MAAARLMGMPGDVPAELAEMVRLQHGVLTVAQAQAAGISRDMLRSRARTGHWQRLHDGVYATFSGEPGRAAILQAAVLRAGPGAMLSHQTAAELTGLADERSSLVHLTVPGDRRVRPVSGLVIHYSVRADQIRHPAQSPPRTRVEHTVLDLTDAHLTFDGAYGWVTRALGRRLTTAELLRGAMAQRGRLRWRAQLAEVLGADWAGVHSGLEYRYARDVERPHGLPRSVRQARVRRGSRNEYRDVLYEAFKVAVELDGRIAHPGDTRWRDIYRDNAAAGSGIITLRYGWLDVTQRPCTVAAQVAQTLALRGCAGFRPCGPGCPVPVARVA